MERGWWDRSFQPVGLDLEDGGKPQLLCRRGAGSGLAGRGSAGSELGGGFSGPSLALCPRMLKVRDELITSPNSVLPPSWILDVTSLLF